MKRRRKAKATNKIQGSLEGSLIKAEPEQHYADGPQAKLRSTSITVARSTLFTAELEHVIDMIARERVYRAMLAGLGRRLLVAPSPSEQSDTTGR